MYFRVILKVILFKKKIGGDDEFYLSTTLISVDVILFDLYAYLSPATIVILW